MSRTYLGDVPCSGCGKTGKESRRPTKDSICYQCMDDLNKYRKILERNTGNKDTYVEFDVIAHEIRYTADDNYNNLIGALKQLFISLDTPEADKRSTATPKVRHGNYYNNSFKILREYNYSYNGETRWGEGAFTIREDIAINLDSLMTALENYSHGVYLQGKKDGGNLLKSLGAQEISPDEFVERINRGKYK